MKNQDKRIIKRRTSIESEIIEANITLGFNRSYKSNTEAEAKKLFNDFVNAQNELPNYLRPPKF